MSETYLDPDTFHDIFADGAVAALFAGFSLTHFRAQVTEVAEGTASW